MCRTVEDRNESEKEDRPSGQTPESLKGVTGSPRVTLRQRRAFGAHAGTGTQRRRRGQTGRIMINVPKKNGDEVHLFFHRRNCTQQDLSPEVQRSRRMEVKRGPRTSVALEDTTRCTPGRRLRSGRPRPPPDECGPTTRQSVSGGCKCTSGGWSRTNPSSWCSASPCCFTLIKPPRV